MKPLLQGFLPKAVFHLVAIGNKKERPHSHSPKPIDQVASLAHHRNLAYALFLLRLMPSAGFQERAFVLSLSLFPVQAATCLDACDQRPADLVSNPLILGRWHPTCAGAIFPGFGRIRASLRIPSQTSKVLHLERFSPAEVYFPQPSCGGVPCRPVT